MSNETVRVVFMGTPTFAVPSLQALLQLQSAARMRVVAVFTQPDRPAGRGRHLAVPPVKAAALAAGLLVEQPERLRRTAAVESLAALQPDLIVVAAYAQILSQRVLDLPRFGCLNVHASLLPRHRGAAPIQAAILAGDAVTGVSIMRMELGLDTGPVLSSYSEPINADDTADSLGARLAVGGAALLAQTVPGWLAGQIVPVAQQEDLATMTRPLRKEDGLIDWRMPAAYLERHIRAMLPWPGAYTLLQQQPLKVLWGRAVADISQDLPVATLVSLAGEPAVVTAHGALVLEQVQPAGKRPMGGAAWLRGSSSLLGSRL